MCLLEGHRNSLYRIIKEKGMLDIAKEDHCKNITVKTEQLHILMQLKQKNHQL